MSDRRVEADVLQHGQAGPYQKSVYEARLSFLQRVRGDRDWTPLLVSPEAAQAAFRILVRNGWVDADEQPGEWHLPRMKEIVEEAPNVWRIRVEQPYLD